MSLLCQNFPLNSKISSFNSKTFSRVTIKRVCILVMMRSRINVQCFVEKPIFLGDSTLFLNSQTITFEQQYARLNHSRRLAFSQLHPLKTSSQTCASYLFVFVYHFSKKLFFPSLVEQILQCTCLLIRGLVLFWKFFKIVVKPLFLWGGLNFPANFKKLRILQDFNFMSGFLRKRW